MRLRILSFSTVACLGLTLAACASEDAGSVAETDADLTLGTTLTEADNGSTAAVVEGQSVLVALASNPTTGYDWAVTSVDKSLGYPTTKYVKSGSATGSGGTTKLTWKTPTGGLAVGKHKVTLGYRRSWEAKDIKTFSFTIDIKAAASKAVKLDDTDNGTVAVAKAGQDIVVTLSSNATTGYAWKVTSTDKTFGYPTDKYVAPTSGAVGAGGQQVLTWKTSGPLPMAGTHKVTLQYLKSGSSTPAKTFAFSVKIQN
ncbi:MAG: protease inhibitor I42 family protein [Deltaproteobacteria bacterium]|nr:protease inhibitor I42 family protein [Deltaproteobacteria bacterium]